MFKNKEYSVDTLISLLSDLSSNFDIEGKKEKRLWEKLDKAIEQATNDFNPSSLSHNVINVGGRLYKHIKGNQFETYSPHDLFKEAIFKNYREMVAMSDDYMYIHKNVKLVDGKLFSFFKDSFEYKVGEEIVPDSHGLLYFNLDNEGQYYSNKNSVKLRCKVLLKDVASYGHNVVKVKRCIPIDWVRNSDGTKDLSGIF